MGESAKVPHMTEDGRREWAKEIEEKIYGERKAKPAPLAILKMVGIGVRK